MIAGIVYAAVGVAVWGAAARWWVWREYSNYRTVDGEDYAFALMAGLLAASAWPLALVGAAGYGLLRADVEKNHPRAVARRQADRERAIADREREIARMERELGIAGPDDAAVAPVRQHWFKVSKGGVLR